MSLEEVRSKQQQEMMLAKKKQKPVWRLIFLFVMLNTWPIPRGIQRLRRLTKQETSWNAEKKTKLQHSS